MCSYIQMGQQQKNGNFAVALEWKELVGGMFYRGWSQISVQKVITRERAIHSLQIAPLKLLLWVQQKLAMIDGCEKCVAIKFGFILGKTVV